jgi:hypothetical protein
LPLAFANHDTTLTESQLQAAAAIAGKHADIVKESEHLRLEFDAAGVAMKRVGERYYAFCSELRKAKLNRKESTLLLKALGYVKTRISEILRVSEVDDTIWNQYKDGAIGFKATLALGRGGDEPEDSEEGGETEEAPKPAKKKEKRLPKEYAATFAENLADWGGSLKETTAKEPYVMRYEDEDKRTYVVTLQIIEAKSE